MRNMSQLCHFKKANVPKGMFCAGADLSSELNSGPEETVRSHRDGGGRVALAIHRCRKPVIGAINGSAVGIGITMTLPMSIRIVSAEAKVGFVFARRGIVMEACSSFFLPRLVGYGRAMELITTGRVYGAGDNVFDGLWSEVLPKEKVLERALEVADEVAENTSAVSTHLMKDMIWRNPGSAEGTHLLDSRLLVELFRGRDKEEGVKSFLEKRGPVFEGVVGSDAPGAWPWWDEVDVRAEGEGKAKL